MNKLQEYDFKMKKCNISKLTITYSFFSLLEENICLTSSRVKYVSLSILLCFLLYCLFVLQCHVEIAKACTPRSVKLCCQQHPRLTQFWFIASIVKNKTKGSLGSALLGTSQSKTLLGKRCPHICNQPLRKLMPLGTAELEVENWISISALTEISLKNISKQCSPWSSNEQFAFCLASHCLGKIQF